MTILVDMDDTLVDLMTKSVYYFNSLYEPETPLRLGDLKSWELPEIEKWRSIWKIPGFFADLPPFEGALNVLRRMSEGGHEIVVVTAAPTWDSCAGKYQWVHTHLRIPGIIQSMGQFVITRDKWRVRGDIIIDDKVSNLLDHPAPHKICFARPWNDEWKEESGLLRAFDWDMVEYDLEEIFDG